MLNKDIYCRQASLILSDEDGNETRYDMFWCGDFFGNKECWECDCQLKNKGIYWYCFELETDSTAKVISRGTCAFGILSDKFDGNKHENWQITVYDKDFEEGKFLEGGIMYQIFPDRFFCSGKEKINVPADRVIHKKWGEEPIYNFKKDDVPVNFDYFGGDILGIVEKLDYLKKMGVTCIYLNPIFEAHSNHRYNTANYKKTDALLGTEKDFVYLCEKAEKNGIKIILDGVFSHTGSDSVYFNKEKRYESKGAFNSKDSEYFNWYNFKNWPLEYDSWWGFETLPEVNEMNEDYCEFICGKNGVVEKWLGLGASGYRLDVADELPDEFIEKIKKSSVRVKEGSIIIGEVWEDASNKVSYSKRRSYLLGGKLDSVMNYPFRSSIIDFLSGKNAELVMDSILRITENYPKPALNILMNSLGTHDTERILSIISGDEKRKIFSELDVKKQEKTLKKMYIAVAMQYTLPGVPCIYYGDEAGLLGDKDPFCRRCFPWEAISEEIYNFYIVIGKLRKDYTALKDGELTAYICDENLISYVRENDKDFLFCAFNMSEKEKIFELPQKNGKYNILMGSAIIENNKIDIPPKGFAIASQ